MTHRHWCFTYNNPALTPEGMLDLWEDSPLIRYAIFQEEIARTGTPHYQGYVELSRPARLTQVTRILQCHWEPRRGTRDEARDYCRKDESRRDGTQPHEYGTWRAGGQGSRTDWHSIATRFREGDSMVEIALENPGQYVRYSSGFHRLQNLLAPLRDMNSALDVILYFGEPGAGKTWNAFANFPGIFRKSPDSTWFDGYTGQTSALLDDFAGAASKMSLVFLLQILDKYPLLLQTKGSHVSWNVDTIVITSNIHPRMWYKWEDRENQYKSLARRFTKVVYFAERNHFFECSLHTFFFEFQPGARTESYCISLTPPASPQDPPVEEIAEAMANWRDSQ